MNLIFFETTDSSSLLRLFNHSSSLALYCRAGLHMYIFKWLCQRIILLFPVVLGTNKFGCGISKALEEWGKMLVLGDRYLGRSVAHFPCSILLKRHGGLSDIYLLWQTLFIKKNAIWKCKKKSHPFFHVNSICQCLFFFIALAES